jgi:hypothetical protein
MTGWGKFLRPYSGRDDSRSFSGSGRSDAGKGGWPCEGVTGA